MKHHRFYYQGELTKDIWVDDTGLLNQWLRVLRYKPSSQLVLFDGKGTDRLYQLVQIGNNAVKLELVTELVKQQPGNEVYLLFSLLKKDKNDWVLQKCTELGVRHFVPILSDRTEKTGFSLERAEKISVEAAEQCGRSDIPKVREPISLTAALKEFNGKIKLYYAEQSDQQPVSDNNGSIGIFVGPEGGWSEDEKVLLATACQKLNLSQFTLRAETACMVAAAKLIQ